MDRTHIITRIQKCRSEVTECAGLAKSSGDDEALRMLELQRSDLGRLIQALKSAGGADAANLFSDDTYSEIQFLLERLMAKVASLTLPRSGGHALKSGRGA